ncbi:hypothetical protein BsWGS_09320 [Bradybaena similaris]
MWSNCKCVGFFLGFCVLHFFAQVVSTHDEGHGSGRIDPFLEILKQENISSSNVLPVSRLDSFVVRVFQHVNCGGLEFQSTPQCSLCVRTTDLTKLAAVNTSLGVREEEFQKICLVLLNLLTQVKQLCHTRVDLSNVTLKLVTASLLQVAGVSQTEHAHLHASDIIRLLDTFKGLLVDHHDPDHAEHTDGDHDHVEEHAAHEHGDAVEEHDHDHDHDHDDESLVVKEQCLSGDALLYYMGEEHSVEAEELGRLATFIIYFITNDYKVEDKCRLLPQKGGFIDNLFSRFAAAGSNISLVGLENLMTQLGIKPMTHSHPEHAHEESHVHSHRKRSVGGHDAAAASTNGNSLESSFRVKRQAADQASFQKCYTAKQIMALYDLKDGIDQASFQQLCPSLVSQKLYADCSQTEDVKSASTEAERYGYSTIAVAIVCLCSVFGVIFIPCVSQTVYDILMSMFVGLAVGTLFADAILHLIPQAMGAHVHGGHGGHEHGDEIVVESFVLYGLAIMAGLYFFYILENVMSRYGSHSHSHTADDTDIIMYDNTHSKHGSLEADAEPPKDKSRKSYVVRADSPGTRPDEKPNNKTCGMTPVALMIILGDGIHNFADGLAIGASFTNSISSGIATSIAVFCHELPHELGDFAVLLQSGLSFKKAVFLNLGSALTAFAGLYVSLSVSHGEAAQRWIFAVTSGMFLYIALVDLLPQLIKTRGALHFTLNNIGILIGFAIMLVIAIFEEHIKV